MIPKPKFEIGDCFKLALTGQVHGINVTVHKPCVVTAVCLVSKNNVATFVYTLYSDFGPDIGPYGSNYSYNEVDLAAELRVEPVAEAIRNAQP